MKGYDMTPFPGDLEFCARGGRIMTVTGIDTTMPVLTQDSDGSKRDQREVVRGVYVCDQQSCDKEPGGKRTLTFRVPRERTASWTRVMIAQVEETLLQSCIQGGNSGGL